MESRQIVHDDIDYSSTYYLLYVLVKSKKWYGAWVSAAFSPVQHTEFIDLTTMFTLQTSFKPLLIRGGGGGPLKI